MIRSSVVFAVYQIAPVSTPLWLGRFSAPKDARFEQQLSFPSLD
jgi:hypothetical protein